MGGGNRAFVKDVIAKSFLIKRPIHVVSTGMFCILGLKSLFAELGDISEYEFHDVFDKDVDLSKYILGASPINRVRRERVFVQNKAIIAYKVKIRAKRK